MIRDKDPYMVDRNRMWAYALSAYYADNYIYIKETNLQIRDLRNKIKHGRI